MFSEVPIPSFIMSNFLCRNHDGGRLQLPCRRKATVYPDYYAQSRVSRSGAAIYMLLIWVQNRLTTKYTFAKPNDRRALDLMNAAAVAVMKDLPDLVLAYGQSDEYRCVIRSGLTSARLKEIGDRQAEHRSAEFTRGVLRFEASADMLHSFVFHKDCTLFERRARYGAFTFRPRSSLHEWDMLCNDGKADVYLVN
jgi:hypothetical protein